MCPIEPHHLPLHVIAMGDEVVFLGQGPINFSMSRQAAKATLDNLAEALRGPAGASASAVVVLLVEDEPLVRDIGETVLRDAGYVVIVAESAKAALLVLETGDEVHVLFTDVQMPGELDGLQLARMVGDRWPTIRLLVTSGNPPRSLDALPAGVRFLAKPYAVADVLRHVGELAAA